LIPHVITDQRISPCCPPRRCSELLRYRARWNGVRKNTSSMILFRLSRRGDTDTDPERVSLLEFDIHYPVDVLGSQSEYVKFTP